MTARNRPPDDEFSQTSSTPLLGRDQNPFLSVVIPAFNEEHRLPSTIGAIKAYLSAQSYTWELIVVDDGSDDRTVDVARRLVIVAEPCRILEIEHRGKAAAVRAGVLAARGENILFSDADLSTPISAVAELLAMRQAGYDVVIGSREGASAQRLGEPVYRHYMGRAFNWVVRAIAVRGVKDTQCGFKLFSRLAADRIFPKLRLHQTDAALTGPRVSAFDVELLYIARRQGFRIAEVPVVWTHVPGSKVRPGLDALRMFVDVLFVRLNALRGKYN
ncbi:glycosyltransferase family 2 protein [soil metagenome]